MENLKTSKGYVYVVINSSKPNLVKIGKTTKAPNEKVKELSSATGVATPFILIYHRQFNNCHSAEKKIHTILEDKGVRFSDSREFFEISTTDAIHIVQNIDDEKEVVSEFIENASEDNIENIGKLYFMFMDAASIIVQYQQGSTALIQRKLSLGYARAGRIMDQLEEFGIVGPSAGSKEREVKVKTLEELKVIFQRMGF